MSVGGNGDDTMTPRGDVIVATAAYYFQRHRSLAGRVAQALAEEP